MVIASTVSAFVQVVVALLVVVGFFLLAFYVYNREALNVAVAKSVKKHTYIFRGIKDLAINNNESYNTSDTTHPTYREVPNSINQLGGAEFTYSFWMYKYGKTLDETSADNFETSVNDSILESDLILFVRGSKRNQRFKDVCKSTPADPANIMTKCPLVKFQGPTWDYLVVELNTQDNPNAVKEQSRDSCKVTTAREWSKANAHKIALGGFSDTNFIDKWFMVTIVVSDTEPTDNLPVRNKIHVQIYVNGVLELDRYVDNAIGEVSSEKPSVLLQNRGPLHVAPTITGGTGWSVSTPTESSDNLFMANLSYMSYAASPDDIKTLYKEGFDKIIAPSINQSEVSKDRYASTYENRSLTSGDPQLVSF